MVAVKKLILVVYLLRISKLNQENQLAPVEGNNRSKNYYMLDTDEVFGSLVKWAKEVLITAKIKPQLTEPSVNRYGAAGAYSYTHSRMTDRKQKKS